MVSDQLMLTGVIIVLKKNPKSQHCSKKHIFLIFPRLRKPITELLSIYNKSGDYNWNIFKSFAVL